jgi:hypothetical protein
VYGVYGVYGVWGGYRKGKNNSWLTFLYFLKGLIAGYSQGYRKAIAGYSQGYRKAITGYSRGYSQGYRKGKIASQGTSLHQLRGTRYFIKMKRII